MDDLISRQAAIDVIRATVAEGMLADTIELRLNGLPSAESEWNNHTVACLLADMYGDTCACNYDYNDEWLPKYCEVIDDCPNPVGVACWEQFLTHRARMAGEEE